MEKGELGRVLVVSITILSLVLASSVAYAHIGIPIDSGWAATSPTINGTMASGEWASATVRNFTLEMRSRSNGALNRTLAGTFYVMNNRTYLFMAIRIYGDDYEAQDFSNRYDGIAVLFDGDNDAVLSVGDNGEGFTAWVGSPFYSKNDLYYAGGGFWDADVNAGATNDGAFGRSHTNPVQGAIGDWTFEMKIPLVGSDGSAYDFAITTLPKTVGYKIWFQEPSKGLDGVYPDEPAVTKNIEEISNAATFGDLTIHPLYTLTITATTGGTTNPAPGAYQYPYKTLVNVTAIPNPMYEFDHWELDTVNVGAANPYTVTMDQNHTLKAVFHPLYALTIITTTGGTTNPVPGTYIYHNGTSVSVTATKDPGNEFDHWELETVDVGTANPYIVLMNQNHTLKAVFVKALAVSITPPSATIDLGDSVVFNSVVTGGTPSYNYQWYVNSSKVLGATSASWTFTPLSIGTYKVYLNVSDSRGRIAISNTATVIVKKPPTPAGGYTISLDRKAPTSAIAGYASLLAAISIVTCILKRKKK